MPAADLEDEAFHRLSTRNGDKVHSEKKPAAVAKDDDEDEDEDENGSEAAALGDGDHGDEGAASPAAIVATTKKRPAASMSGGACKPVAAMAAMKRPAASMPSIKDADLRGPWAKADMKKYASKESWACAIRLKAKRFAGENKFSPKATKALMSQAYKAASAAW